MRLLLRPFRCLSIFFAAMLICGAPAMAERGMTARLLTTMDRLTDSAVSPDGRWVAYVVRTQPADLSRASTHLMLIDRDRPGAAHRRLDEVSAWQDMPTWSADGRSLFFRAPDANGIAQIWRIAMEGLPPEQLTHAPLDVGSFQVAPDSSFAVISFRVYPDCPTLDCTVSRAAMSEAGRLYTRLDVRFYDSYGDGRYNSLFKVDLVDAAAPVHLMPDYENDVPTRPSGDASAFAISPDGTRLIFAARQSGVPSNLSAVHRLYEVSLAVPGVPIEIASQQPGSHFNPVFSPDGRLLAYLDKPVPGSDGDRAFVCVRDLATGNVRGLGLGLNRWPNEIIWSADGRTLYARSDDNGVERLFAYRLSGAVERLPVDGVSAIAVSRRGLIVRLSSFSRPPQLYSATGDGRALRPLTDIGAGQLVGVGMAPTHSFTFAGWNGEPVQAFVTEPLNRDPARRYPVLFLIHGGPHGVYQDEWSYGRNPQVWAARGYATVMVNFHGSTGFGQEFAHAVLEHRGDRVLEDLRRGWGAAQQAYPFLDGNRACAMGSSFGGYMIYWIAGVWNEPWRCLISHAGTFDSRAYTSDIQWHGDRQTGGTPWDNPEGVERFNPVNHVTRWERPILITHGGRDYRVPLDQGLSAFTLAQRRGIPSEMLYLPNEGHVIAGPAASIRWYEVVDAWLDRWTAP